MVRRVGEQQQLQPGDVVWQYEIDKFLGNGAFGNVYMAHHRTMTRRRVAIKQLRMMDSSPAIVQRFIHESYAMGELLHPNVVLIYELIEPDKYPNVNSYYIVMEYLDGGTLQEWMDRQDQPLKSLQDIIWVIKEVLLGLAAAHHQNIIHRDIKPENILLSQDGKYTKIGDWGLAHLDEHRMTHLGDIIGTMDYMSPEQASGQSAAVDGRADLYSVGVILYQMVTGTFPLDLDKSANLAVMKYLERNPFDAANKQLLNQLARKAILDTIANAERIDPRVETSDLPEELVRVLMKAIAIRPEDRYQTAEEFIEALDHISKKTKSKVQSQTKLDDRIPQVASLLVQARQHRLDRNYSQALQMLEQARSLIGDDPGVCLELSHVYNLLGRNKDAAKVLEEALKSTPDNYVLLRDLGITYMGLKEREKACALLERSLALNPNQSRVVTLFDRLKGGQ